MAKALEATLDTTLRRGSLEATWGEVMMRILERCEAWEQRWSQRRALAELDDRALADIGVSRSEAAAEVAKPFWLG